MMPWDKCKREFIRDVEIDLERVASITKQAGVRLKIIKKVDVTDESVGFLVENYYEIIKELLVAYLLKEGMRSKNHQCLISFFLLRNPNFESETMLISRMSYYRNRLLYYGDKIPSDFYHDNISEFEKIIDLLKRLLG